MNTPEPPAAPESAPTPRTDQNAISVPFMGPLRRMVVPADFARELERELAQTKAYEKHFMLAAREWQQHAEKSDAEVQRLSTENAQLRELVINLRGYGYLLLREQKPIAAMADALAYVLADADKITLAARTTKQEGAP